MEQDFPHTSGTVVFQSPGMLETAENSLNAHSQPVQRFPLPADPGQNPNNPEVVYRVLQTEVLKPANQAWEDDIRKKLDQRLFTEVLNLDNNAVEQLDIIRRQWCSEPTVTSTKGTGPPQ